MIKVALIKDNSFFNYYYTREYKDEEDLEKRDKTMEYGEFNDIDCAIENLAETFKGEEFIIKLKI